jgi:hypothetical protein
MDNNGNATKPTNSDSHDPMTTSQQQSSIQPIDPTMQGDMEEVRLSVHCKICKGVEESLESSRKKYIRLDSLSLSLEQLPAVSVSQSVSHSMNE